MYPVPCKLETLLDARLAQLAEHYLDTVGVTSSNLVPRTIFIHGSAFSPRLRQHRLENFHV